MQFVHAYRVGMHANCTCIPIEHECHTCILSVYACQVCMYAKCLCMSSAHVCQVSMHVTKMCEFSILAYILQKQVWLQIGPFIGWSWVELFRASCCLFNQLFHQIFNMVGLACRWSLHLKILKYLVLRFILYINTGFIMWK